MRRACDRQRRAAEAAGAQDNGEAGRCALYATQPSPIQKDVMVDPVEPRAPLTKIERAARDAQRRVDAQKAISEHEAEERRKFKNMERLRAERRAREAAVNQDDKG